MRSSIALFLLLFQPHVLAGQDNGRPNIGPLGALPPQRGAVRIPNGLLKQLPARAVPLIAKSMNLTTEGELVVIFEIRDKMGYSDSAGAIIARNGQILKSFDLGEDCSLLSNADFVLEAGRKALALSLMCSGDGSALDFSIIAFDKGSYEEIFTAMTTQGRVRILEGAPLRLEVWSARDDLPGSDSCVWCPHRYQIKNYVWQSGRFTQKGSHLTSGTLNPGNVIQTSIKLVRSGTT